MLLRVTKIVWQNPRTDLPTELYVQIEDDELLPTIKLWQVIGRTHKTQIISCAFERIDTQVVR